MVSRDGEQAYVDIISLLTTESYSDILYMLNCEVLYGSINRIVLYLQDELALHLLPNFFRSEGM